MKIGLPSSCCTLKKLRRNVPHADDTDSVAYSVNFEHFKMLRVTFSQREIIAMWSNSDTQACRQTTVLRPQPCVSSDTGHSMSGIQLHGQHDTWYMIHWQVNDDDDDDNGYVRIREKCQTRVTLFRTLRVNHKRGRLPATIAEKPVTYSALIPTSNLGVTSKHFPIMFNDDGCQWPIDVWSERIPISVVAQTCNNRGCNMRQQFS